MASADGRRPLKKEIATEQHSPHKFFLAFSCLAKKNFFSSDLCSEKKKNLSECISVGFSWFASGDGVNVDLVMSLLLHKEA